MIEQIENKVKNVAKPDWIGNSKTIYDVGSFEVFWRNFVAGMGRALGTIIMYFLFVYVIYATFVNLIFPTLKPYLDGYMNLLNIMGRNEQLQTGQSNSVQLDEQDITNLLQQFGRATR